MGCLKVLRRREEGAEHIVASVSEADTTCELDLQGARPSSLRSRVNLDLSLTTLTVADPHRVRVDRGLRHQVPVERRRVRADRDPGAAHAAHARGRGAA